MRRRGLGRFLAEERGAIAPTIALSLIGLIAAGGIAFDYARMAALDTELQGAADQAALAAASQLDGLSGACGRASAAAVNLLANQARFANDGGAIGVTVTAEPTCDATGSIRFWQDEAATQAATSDADAHFVEVTVNSRRANFALTPIVAAITSGDLTGTALAGLGSAICQVPPLMICNPTPGTPFDADAMRGRGIVVVAHQNGQSWSPGNFGFLNAGQENNGAPDLLAAMAYQDARLSCMSIQTGDVDTGATVPAIDAANTRFDIYNFGGGGGSTLGACTTGACPPARNVTKDLVRPENANGNNSCRIHNSGWQLPNRLFSPRPAQTGDTAMTQLDQDGQIDAMGLPRDNCHYTSFGSACPQGRVGTGNWARGDYFNKYHAGNAPAGAATMTRYETYLWEIAQNNMPNGANAGGTLRQYGAPICTASNGNGALDPTRDRRVFSVAIAENCSSLSGSSVPVEIGDWVDMFFVEPGLARPTGATSDEIYLEVIGRSRAAGGNGAAAQTIRRDTPYLVR